MTWPLWTTLSHRDGTIDVLRWRDDRYETVERDVDEETALDLLERCYSGEGGPS